MDSPGRRCAVAPADEAGSIGGAGGDNALDTQVSSLNATAGTTGGIWIKETDAVTLNSVTTTNGSIEVEIAREPRP